MAMHVSPTFINRVRFRISATENCLIKATLVTCEKSVIQSDCAKHSRFSPGAPDSLCSNRYRVQLVLVLKTVKPNKYSR